MFAGIADLARPADKLSVSQSSALATTGKRVFLLHNWVAQLLIRHILAYYSFLKFVRTVNTIQTYI